MRRRPPFAVAAGVALLALGAAGPAATAPAGPGTATTTTPADPGPPPSDAAALRAQAARWALPLLRTVDADGRLPDPEGRAVGYGEAMLGAAGLRIAVDGSPEALAPSLRLLERAAGTLARAGDALRPTVAAGGRTTVEDGRWDPFALWALVDAHAVGGAFADDPRWRPARDALRDAFAGRPLVRPTRYTNRTLVEAAAVAALPPEATVGARPGAAAANPTGTRARLRRMLRILPRRSGPPVRATTWLGGGRVLSDAPRNPLAYQALSLAALDELRGLRGAGGDRAALRGARHLLAVAAPDGELAWAGRSDRQSWTLAAAVLVGRRLAVGADAPARRGGGRLAADAVARLARAHPPRADGLPAIVPALAGAPAADAARLIPPGAPDGVDRYASTATYGALTAWLLHRAADVPDAPASAPTRSRGPDAVAAERSGSLVDPGGAHVASLRRGDWWVGVVTDAAGTDLRGLPGLAVLKRRTARGWVDVLAARPRVSRAPDLPRRIDGTPFRVRDVRASRTAIELRGGWGALPGAIGLELDGRGLLVRIRGLRNVEIAAWSSVRPALAPDESPEGGGGSRPVPLPGGRLLLPPRSLRLPATGPVPSATHPAVWESRTLPAVGRDGVVARFGP